MITPARTELIERPEGLSAEEALGDAPSPLWLRALAGLIALVPYGWLRPLGSALGLLVGGVLRVRRAHVTASLCRAGFERASRIATGMYASLGTGVLELLWMTGRPREELARRVTIAPSCADALRRAAARGKGVVVATAHTGNWDVAACAAASWLEHEEGMGPLTVVTKRLSVRSLDRSWQRARAERGVRLVPADGAVRTVRGALGQGGFVALLVDQVPERASGVAVFPFLGAPARHDLAPALLAARAGAPIVIVFGHREADGHHRLECAGVLEPEALRGGHAAVRRATEAIASALEAYVRKRPEQWLWMHRRWKGIAG